jgi:hypothetical protein
LSFLLKYRSDITLKINVPLTLILSRKEILLMWTLRELILIVGY